VTTLFQTVCLKGRSASTHREESRVGESTGRPGEGRPCSSSGERKVPRGLLGQGCLSKSKAITRLPGDPLRANRKTASRAVEGKEKQLWEGGGGNKKAKKTRRKTLKKKGGGDHACPSEDTRVGARPSAPPKDEIYDGGTKLFSKGKKYASSIV